MERLLDCLVFPVTEIGDNTLLKTERENWTQKPKVSPLSSLWLQELRTAKELRFDWERKCSIASEGYFFILLKRSLKFNDFIWKWTYFAVKYNENPKWVTNTRNAKNALLHNPWVCTKIIVPNRKKKKKRGNKWML